MIRSAFLKEYSVYTIENGLVQTITRLLSRQKVMNGDSCGVGEEWTGLKDILEVKSTGQSQHLLNILFMSDTGLSTGNTKKKQLDVEELS